MNLLFLICYQCSLSFFFTALCLPIDQVFETFFLSWSRDFRTLSLSVAHAMVPEQSVLGVYVPDGEHHVVTAKLEIVNTFLLLF